MNKVVAEPCGPLSGADLC